MRSKVAVFASGSGSNFQALVEYTQRGDAAYEVALLVCDQPQAYVIERAKRSGISVFAFSAKDYPDKQAFETEILAQLQAYEIEWVVLAGYMRLIGTTLLDAYEGRMINLHPSLLPAFAGKDGIGDAYRHGVKVTGVTVHFVDAGLDTGPIIAQEAVMIEEGDRLEDVARKIHAMEHQLLPKVVNDLALKQRDSTFASEMSRL